MCVCVYVWCVFINEGKGVKYNSIEFFYITVDRQKLLLIQLNLSELYHKSTYSKPLLSNQHIQSPLLSNQHIQSPLLSKLFKIK